MKFLSVLISASLVLLHTAFVGAATPTMINYQGRLTNGAGVPVADSTYSVIFTIYDAASGGTAVWTESQSVSTIDGLFCALLGSSAAITDMVFSASTRYLGIRVGSDPEISPRVTLVTVPYSFRTSTLDGSRGGFVSGNISLETSTAAGGNILKNGMLFLHNYGNSNLFVGLNSGNQTMSGHNNTGLGGSSLFNNTSGSYNTSSGHQALFSNTTGNNNTAVGWWTLFNNTTGSQNTANGLQALYHNTIGNLNTALGDGALFANDSGQNNTACGRATLYNSTKGNHNTAIGFEALHSNTTGSYNTALGYGSNVSGGNFTNATAIGANAVVNASNKIRFGNSSVSEIEGAVAYTFTSDGNQKENFKPLNGEEILTKICDLEVTSWNYIGQDPLRFRHYGPIAQDFYAAFGHDGLGNSGTSTTINSGDMAGIMMAAIQALEKRTAELDVLKAEIKELKALVTKLDSQAKVEYKMK